MREFQLQPLILIKAQCWPRGYLQNRRAKGFRTLPAIAGAALVLQSLADLAVAGWLRE
jgi:hypothetical protein